MLDLYAAIAILLFVAIMFPIVPLILAHFVRPHRPNSVKLATYESGMEPIGPAWVQYHVGFYMYALSFVIFDVEILFLYPWALAYNQLGLFALIQGAIFIAILSIGLVYEIKKGVLRWW